MRRAVIASCIAITVAVPLNGAAQEAPTGGDPATEAMTTSPEPGAPEPQEGTAVVIDVPAGAGQGHERPGSNSDWDEFRLLPALTAGTSEIDVATTLFALTQGNEGGRISVTAGLDTSGSSDSHAFALTLSSLDDDKNGTADLLQFDNGLQGGIELSFVWNGTFRYSLDEQRDQVRRQICARPGAPVPCDVPGDLQGNPSLLQEYYDRVRNLPLQTPIITALGAAAGYHRLDYRNAMDAYRERTDEQPSVRVFGGVGWYPHPNIVLAGSATLQREITAPKQRAVCTGVMGADFDCPIASVAALSATWFVEPRLEVRFHIHPTFALAITGSMRIGDGRDLAFTNSSDESSFQLRYTEVRVGAYLALPEGVRIALTPGIRAWNIAHDDDRDDVADGDVEFVGAITLGAALDNWRP